MKTDKLFQNGCIFAAILGTTVVFMGSTSESHSQKFAIIDREEINQKSQYITKKFGELEGKFKLGMKFFDVLKANKTVNEAKAKELKDLILDPRHDKAHEEKIDKLKYEIEESEKEYNNLSQKPNLTEAEKDKLKDYSKTANNSPQLMKGFEYQLKQELETFQMQVGAEVNKHIKEAHTKIAKSKGFTLVFDTSAAVYSPNDLTQAVIDELDKEKK